MSEKQMLFINTEPDFDTIPYPYPNPPTKAIIREVDIELVTSPRGVHFEFSYSQYTRIQNVPDDQAFQALLKKIADPRYAYDGGPSVINQPFSTKLTLDSQNTLAYVIFKLSSKVWKYDTSVPPIRIGRAASEAEAYYDATLYSEDVAYFISDGPKALAKGTYPHPFNLFVEFEQTIGDPIKVKIDPDVRHPGGSSE